MSNLLANILSFKESNEFLYFVIVSLVYSIMIFCVSIFIKNTRRLNILGIDYTFLNFIWWVLGSVFVWIILDTTGIVSRSYITVLVVCFVWDTIFKKLFNKSNEMSDKFPGENI